MPDGGRSGSDCAQSRWIKGSFWLFWSRSPVVVRRDDDVYRYADAYQNNQRRKAEIIFPEEGVVLLPQDMFISKAPTSSIPNLVDFILSRRVNGAKAGADLAAPVSNPLPDTA
jgi:ABC-type Fe3+ transport system substrate-binding protein